MCVCVCVYVTNPVVHVRLFDMVSSVMCATLYGDLQKSVVSSISIGYIHYQGLDKKLSPRAICMKLLLAKCCNFGFSSMVYCTQHANQGGGGGSGKLGGKLGF